MSGRVAEFCDTNIVVYAHDRDAGSKRDVARRLLLDLCAADQCRLSPQVLQEFYVTVTGKLARPLEPAQAAAIVSDLAHWAVAATDAADVEAGVAMAQASRISLWDAMIVVAAKKCGAGIVWSEDLQDGARYGGVLIRNPFVL